MKKLTLATALVASLCAMNVQAYQTEVGASVGFVDPDNGDGAASFGVDGAYYFKDVKINNKTPYNEAAFLNRASNIHAQGTYAKADETKDTNFVAGIDYFVPNTNFYAGLDVNYNRLDVNSVDNKTTVTTAQVGYLPTQGLLLAAGLSYLSNDLSISDLSSKETDTNPFIRAKYVTNFVGHDWNFEGSAAFGGDTNVYNAAADFYVDPTLSLGVSYNAIDTDGADTDDNFGINAKKFFNQQVSLEGNVNFADSSNTYGLRLGYRF